MPPSRKQLAVSPDDAAKLFALLTYYPDDDTFSYPSGPIATVDPDTLHLMVFDQTDSPSRHEDALNGLQYYKDNPMLLTTGANMMHILFSPLDAAKVEAFDYTNSDTFATEKVLALHHSGLFKRLVTTNLGIEQLVALDIDTADKYGSLTGDQWCLQVSSICDGQPGGHLRKNSYRVLWNHI